jgi:DNA invertase Pin-like site-specific DNA recombinase
LHGFFAEFERISVVSASAKGIATVKAAGTYQGRAASNAIRLREMKAQGFGAKPRGSAPRPSPGRSALAGRASIGY